MVQLCTSAVILAPTVLFTTDCRKWSTPSGSNGLPAASSLQRAASADFAVSTLDHGTVTWMDGTDIAAMSKHASHAYKTRADGCNTNQHFVLMHRPGCAQSSIICVILLAEIDCLHVRLADPLAELPRRLPSRHFPRSRLILLASTVLKHGVLGAV